MAFELMQKHSRGPNGRSGDWLDKPCIAVNKTLFTFNECASSVFGLKVGVYVQVLFQMNPYPAIAFKIASNGDPANFQIRASSSGGGKPLACFSYDELRKRVSFAVGKVYRIGLNSGERVIEVKLTTENEAKT